MLVRHSVIYFFSRALPGLINLAALSLYTHLLSPAEYGRYALVIYGVGLANTMVYWWLRLGLIRFAPRFAQDQSIFLATLLGGFLLACGASILIALGLLLTIHDTHIRVLVAYSMLLLWISAWFDINMELIRSRLSPIYFGVLSLSRAGLSISIGASLVLAGCSVWGLLIGALASVVIPGVWETIKSWRHVRLRDIDHGVLRELFIYGLPLIGVFGMEYVVSTSDRFMLGWLIGAAATGTYSASYDLTNQSLTLCMGVIYLAGYPLIVKTLEAEGEPAIRILLSRYLGILLAIGLAAVIIVGFSAKDISGIMLGSRFHGDAVGIMPWIAVATLFACLKTYFFDIAFQLSRRTSRQFFVIALPAALNVLLNFLWIPRMGVAGAAYATFAAYLSAVILSWGLGRREFVMPIFSRDVFRVLASAGMMAAGAALMSQGGASDGIASLVFRVATLLGLYGGMITLLNAFGVRNWLSARAREWLKRGARL